MGESLKGKRRILKVRVIAKASNSAPKTTCRDVEIKNVEYMMNKLCSKNEIIEINKIIKMMKIELNSDNKEKIIKLVEQLNEKTKGFAEKIINSNFSNFVGKKIDCIETK